MSGNLAILMENRMFALYVHNEANRLVSVNEPDTNQPTPRFVIMRSAEHILWRVKHDESDDTIAKLEKLIKSEPPTSDFTIPLKYEAEYLGILEQNKPIKSIRSGPAYTLPELPPTENTVQITAHNAPLVKKHFPYTVEILDFRSPVITMIEDEIAVAVCFSARKTQTVAEAGVFTVEGYRKKGYAYKVVRDWAIAIRKMGIEPIYSTSYDNIASQSIANKLGAIQFATDFSFI